MRAGLIAPGAVVLAPNAPPGSAASTTTPINREERRRHPNGDAPPQEGEQP
jgi:hypothetical protein